MKKVIILGIDNFSKKNINQIKCLNNYGFNAYIFTIDVLGNSFDNNFGENKIIKLKSNFFKRTIQVFKFLLENKKDIHHVEIYPGGRFSPIYVILSKLFNLKTIAVERGDLLYWDEYSKFFRKILSFVYKNVDLVWYREIYMEDILKKLNSKKLSFIHNCIEPQNSFKSFKNKEYSFLWVNRLIKERKIEWFVDILNEKKIKKNAVLGVLNQTVNIHQDNILSMNNKEIEVYDYQNPIPFYKNSKFFVLPADIVFVNNALLEAMSYGVVPLISNVEGSSYIIDDGVDGFIFEHNKESFSLVLEKANTLSEDEYEMMSENTIKKIENIFSFDTWSDKYIEMIKNIK